MDFIRFDLDFLPHSVQHVQFGLPFQCYTKLSSLVFVGEKNPFSQVLENMCAKSLYLVVVPSLIVIILSAQLAFSCRHFLFCVP